MSKGHVQHGRLFVMSAPSGAGKTSLARALVERDPGIVSSISYTTRPARDGEVPGEDYYFVSRGDFEAMVRGGEFLEHAHVFDNYYGTHGGQVESQLARGLNVLLEIDWQGARQAREAMPGSVSIFVLPPSRTELERRLHGRGTDTPEVISRRLADAESDMSHWDEFDYVVVNDDFEAALEQLRDIVAGRGEALRRNRPELAPLVRELVANAR